MAEYIEREALIRKLESTITNPTTAFVNNVLIGLLEKAPTADVVEVVHGVWEETDNIVIEHGMPTVKGKTWLCNVCGEARKTRVNPDMNYCPNCGAKMDKS